MMSDVYEIMGDDGWVRGYVRWDRYVVIEPYKDAEWRCRVELGSAAEVGQVIAALTALRKRFDEEE